MAIARGQARDRSAYRGEVVTAWAGAGGESRSRCQMRVRHRRRQSRAGHRFSRLFQIFCGTRRRLADHVFSARTGGCIFVSFGPTWYHPLGGHLFSVFPWVHILLTEDALIRWRAQFKTDGARKFGEVEDGLNQMTIRRFEAKAGGDAACALCIVMTNAV